ncbi:RNA-guided endonuclease InsQ/TnpB family protein [Brachybacterium kimchii]|uniref:Transposase n=1 Tax=Brachybacterium kimchii TaxID=2942909 RepID=A0ABY4N7E7_9MICO|nr:transposase [Brachybacterium kimchii]UQN30483.1 transposase [Brachybacterium kimchii]
MAIVERLRAYKYALDPTLAQRARLEQCAGAARHAHNLLVAENRARGDRYRLLRDHLVTLGRTPAQIKTDLRQHDLEHPEEPVHPISYQAYATRYLTGMIAGHRDAAARIAAGERPEDAWNNDRFDEPWMHEISRRVHVSGLQHADAAVKNWFASLTGARKGRRVGEPRFKKKGQSRDSFTIPSPEAMGPRSRYHRGLDERRGQISDYRHVRLASLGTLRTHDTTKRLVRALDRGAALRSFTVSRSGTRWYVSLLTAENVPEAQPTHAQHVAGVVGVDVGVKVQAALSTGELVDNVRPGARAAKRITRLQRAIARCEKGSRRQQMLYRRLAAAQHHVAQQRATAQHALTKRLATTFEHVAIENLNVAGMSSSACGTLEQPGCNVRQKAGLNRAILDVGFGEIRRQLDYKTSWYGSQLHVIDRYLPSSKTCHACGTVKATLSLRERVFVCECGWREDRDVNAAMNIAAFAVPGSTDTGHLAAGRAERRNGRGDRAAAPPLGVFSGTVDDASRPLHREGPPAGSDPDLFPHATRTR